MINSDFVKKLLLILSLVFALNACVAVGPHRGPYVYPSSTYVEWYYYPDYQVYYHPIGHYYYYSIGGTWRSSARLPVGWVLEGQRRVRVEFSGEPHIHYSEHRHRYPPVYPVERRPGRVDHDAQDRSGREYDRRPHRDTKKNPDMFFPHTKESNNKDEVKLERRPGPGKFAKGQDRQERDASRDQRVVEYESSKDERAHERENRKDNKQVVVRDRENRARQKEYRENRDFRDDNKGRNSKSYEQNDRDDDRDYRDRRRPKRIYR